MSPCVARQTTTTQPAFLTYVGDAQDSLKPSCLLTKESVNNNQWGNDGSGYSCLNVYDQGASFTVTYKWDGDASTVKAFPYMKAQSSNLPIPLQNVSALQITGKWNIYVQGQENDTGLQEAEDFDSFAVKTNVAIDMFLSEDAANSTEVGPPIEVMIWPWYVSDIFPLGYTPITKGVPTVEIDGTKFRLYDGYNLQGQHVFSWLAEKNLTSMDADYGPLLKYMWTNDLLNGTLWLGQLEFGTELMHAAATTVFNATMETLRIFRPGEPGAPHAANTTSVTSSSSSSTPAPTQSQLTSQTSQTPSMTSQAAGAGTSTGTASTVRSILGIRGSAFSAAFWIALPFVDRLLSILTIFE